MLLVASLGSLQSLEPLAHERLGASPVGDVQAAVGVGWTSLAPVVEDALVIRDDNGVRRLEGLVRHVDIALRVTGAADDPIVHRTGRLNHDTLADALIAVVDEVHAGELAVFGEDERVRNDRHGDAVMRKHARRNLAGSVGDADRADVEHFEHLEEPLDVGHQAVVLLEPFEQLLEGVTFEDVSEQCFEVVAVGHSPGHLVRVFDSTPTFDTVGVGRTELFGQHAEDIVPDGAVKVEREDALVARGENMLPIALPSWNFLLRHFILHVSESIHDPCRLEVRLKETLITPQDQRTGSKQPPHG